MREQGVSGHPSDLEEAGVRLCSAQISGKTMPCLSDGSQEHRLFHDREIRCVLRGIYSELNSFSRFFHDFFRESRKNRVLSISIKSTLFEHE